MTKPITINTAASWSTTVTSLADGDQIRENPTFDAIMTSVGDRLGFLKTTVDGKASLSGANTWTAGQVINPASSLTALKVYGEVVFPAQSESLAEATGAGILHRAKLLLDADTANIAPTAETFVIPQTTSNRIYTFGGTGGNPGRRIRVLRCRNGDAHTVKIRDTLAGNDLATMPVSAFAWVDLEVDGAGNWLPVAWASNVTVTFPVAFSAP